MVALVSSAVSFPRHHAPAALAVKGGDCPAIQFDMHRYRTLFPQRWAALLHQHFRGAYHVETFFGVDDKTARDWWHGKTGPAAPFAMYAVAKVPGALQALMGEAA